MATIQKNLGALPVYRGTYNSNSKYYKGNIVTYGGNAYYVTKDTSDEYGNPLESLAVTSTPTNNLGTLSRDWSLFSGTAVTTGSFNTAVSRIAAAEARLDAVDTDLTNIHSIVKTYGNADDVIEEGVYLPDGSRSQLILFVDIKEGTIFQTQVGQNYEHEGKIFRTRTKKSGEDWSTWTYIHAPECVLRKANDNQIVIYSKISDAEDYIAYNLEFEDNYIRLTDAWYCDLVDLNTFRAKFQVLLGNENEFAISLGTPNNYLGGFHGNETTDANKIKFIIDGKVLKLSDLRLQPDGYKVYANKVSYRVFSTIRVTDNITLNHIKETEFNNGGYKVTNKIQKNGTSSIALTGLIAGLVCVHKNCAQAVLTDTESNNSALSLTGSGLTYKSPDYFNKLDKDYSGKITFYNLDNKIVCEVSSRLYGEEQRDEVNHEFGNNLQIEVWDRDTDSKFYFRDKYSKAGSGLNTNSLTKLDFSCETTVNFKKYIEQ